jgi:hypothetical protein
MLMPKAAVHKDYCSLSGKDEVWTTREIASPKSIPVSKSAGQTTNCKFGRRATSSHFPHQYRAGFLRQEIGHLARSGSAYDRRIIPANSAREPPPARLNNIFAIYSRGRDSIPLKSLEPRGNLVAMSKRLYGVCPVPCARPK